MKLIDRHIIRQLVTPILFCSATLVIFLIIVDLFDNLQEFMRNETPLKDILLYYACLIPYAFAQTISWATLLGVIYLLVTFGMHNEILAIKLTGQNITRIAVPLLYVGFTVGIITFIVSDTIVPPTYLKAQVIREQKIKQKASSDRKKTLRHVTCYGKKSVVYYIRLFDVVSDPEDNCCSYRLLPNRRS